MKPSEEDHKEFVTHEYMLATESDDDIIGNDQPLDDNMSINDTIYPSLGFTVSCHCTCLPLILS